MPRCGEDRETRMVEQHYGHLAPSFITDAIHAGAPRFGTSTPSTVVPIPVGKSKRKRNRYGTM